MERAFEPGSGEPGVANDAGWPAGTWDDPVHEQPPKGGLSPITEYDPGTGGSDSAAFRPLSSCCQGSGTLDMSNHTLSESAIERVRAGAPRHLARVAGRGLLVREVSPTHVPGPSCCCAPLGALLKCERVGPGRQSELLRLGSVDAGCLPGAVLLPAQRAARALRFSPGPDLKSNKLTKVCRKTG